MIAFGSALSRSYRTLPLISRIGLAGHSVVRRDERKLVKDIKVIKVFPREDFNALLLSDLQDFYLGGRYGNCTKVVSDMVSAPRSSKKALRLMLL